METFQVKANIRGKDFNLNFDFPTEVVNDPLTSSMGDFIFYSIMSSFALAIDEKYPKFNASGFKKLTFDG